jgi:hypothetical protein
MKPWLAAGVRRLTGLKAFVVMGKDRRRTMKDFAQTDLRASRAQIPSGETGYAVSETYDISVDGDLIVVIGRGFHTNMDDHFAALELIVSKQRLCYPVLRGLIDLKDLAVQPRTVIGDVKDRTRQIWGPRDRVAISVTSALVKIQMTRVAESSNFRVFPSIEQAREWLESA